MTAPAHLERIPVPAGTIAVRCFDGDRTATVIPLLFGARLTLGRTGDTSGYYDGW